jgi:AcrR family transcriptional regulator
VAARSTRTYRSPRRDAQARETRAAVLAAARRLFVAHGYGVTTLQQIAEGAGVAVQTVYAAFGTKRRVLEELLDLAIAGDDAPVAVNDRDWMHDVFHGRDARRRLTAYAAAVRRIHAGAGDVFAVLADAAAADPDVAATAVEAERRRRLGAAAVVDAVLAVAALRPGLSRDQAVDLVWTFNSPEVFRLLVRRRGWSLDAYETWLADALGSSLLGTRPLRPTPSARRRRQAPGL